MFSQRGTRGGKERGKEGGLVNELVDEKFPWPAPFRRPWVFLQMGRICSFMDAQAWPHKRFYKYCMQVLAKCPQPDGKFLFFAADPGLSLYFLSLYPLLADFTQRHCPCVGQEFGHRRCFQVIGPERKGRCNGQIRFPEWVHTCRL